LPFLNSPAARRAREAFTRGDLEQAASLYETMVSQDPHNETALHNLAVLYRQKDDYVGACREYETLHALRPDHAPWLLGWGRSLYCANRLTDSAHVYSQALELEPKNPQALMGRGTCLAELGDSMGARLDLARLLEIQPRDALAHRELARVEDGLRQLDQAQEHYTEALRLDHSLSPLHLALARLYEQERRFPQALERYRKASSAYPDDEEIKAKIRDLASLSPAAGLEESKKYLALQKEREENAPPFLAPADSPGAPLVRVGLLTDAVRLKFRCAAPFLIKEKESGLSLAKGRKLTVYSLDVAEGKGVLKAGEGQAVLAFDKAVILVSDDPKATFDLYDVAYGQGYFFGGAEDRAYRGALEVEPQLHGLKVVNTVSLEEYLYGVLGPEISPHAPLEALKAQAIAARSETVSKLKRGVHRGQGFDLCDEVHCQVYRGVRGEEKSVLRAVEETKAQVLFMGSTVVDAVYMACCGGYTENSEEIWGGERSGLPGVRDAAGRGADLMDGQFPLEPAGLEQFLESAPGSFCDQAGLSYRWQKVLNRDDLARLEQKYKIGYLKQVRIGARSPMGYIKSVVVTGSEGTKTFERDRVRGLLGSLKSNLFLLDQRADETGRLVWVRVEGAGFGHGVGLCQEGAIGMAKKGYTAEEIVKHYYQGAEIRKYY